MQEETTRALAEGATEPRTPTRVVPVVEPRAGDTIDRYTLLTPLGEGGMGVVFAAYDARLDRRVALKLLRPSGSDRAAAWGERRERLLREAQAMAQLSHPNVVEVFDVGTDADALYIAMELVPGQTLRPWLREKTRPWTEVVAMLEQAGRGLAAAHAVELVHRDFKPSNVLVDREGRARVLDFGLALPTHERRGVSSSGIHEVPLGGDPTPTDRLLTPVTEVGVVMGTPAYMAPEQHVGEEVGPAADQYAFCVAAWEALYGRRPFRGADATAVARAKMRGPEAEPPPDAEHPRALHLALVRGLAPAADDRWPSMDALLDELHRLLHPRRSRRVGWLLGGAVAVVGVVAMVASRPGDAPSACDDASASLERVWGEGRREAVHRALLATDVAYARDTADRVQQRLDDYAERWRGAQLEVCGRAQSEAEQQPALDCLDRRLRRMDATISLLEELSADLLPQAVGLAEGLGSLERCVGDRPDQGGLVLPDDPARAEAVRAILSELEDALARIEAGRYEEAHAAVEALLERARDLGHAPLTDLVGGHLGETLLFMGRLDEAEEHLVEAVHRAEAAGRDLEVVVLATQLMHLVGYLQARPEEGMRWARHAEAALERIPEDLRAEAELRTSKGAVLVEAGRREEGVAELQRAVELWNAVGGPDELKAAAAINNLGIAFYELGRYDEAIEQYEQALAIRRRALGPEHPDIGMVLNNLANAQDERGEHDEALALRTEVLELWQASLGPEHPLVAAALNNLGGSAGVLGQHEQALDYYRRALALRMQTLGPEHPEVAAARLNLGATLGELGRDEEALESLRRAQEDLEAAVGDHPWTAIAIGARGEVLSRVGRVDEAVEAFEHSMAVWERQGSTDHPQAAEILRGLGEALIEQGHPQQAVERLEAALAVQEPGGGAPDELAKTRFALARALAELGQRERARTLARAARETWADGRGPMRERLEQVEAWLRRFDADGMPTGGAG